MKRTRFLLLALLMIYTNWAWAVKPCDFEVDGIYYEIIGENEVAVTTKYLEGSDDDYYSEYFTNGGRWGHLEPTGGSYTGSVSIPSSVSYDSKTYRVTTISRQAFYRCTITSISIPNSVINIGKDNDGGSSLFAGCKNLTSINVAEDNPIYDSRNGCNAIIESASNTLISGCRNTTIDNSITTIGRRAFYLVNVDNFTTLPNSVTTIESYAFDYAEFPIFIIPNSVKKVGDAFYGTKFHIINFSSDSCWREYYDFDYYKHIHVYNCPNGEIIDDLVFYHDAAKGNILAKYLGNNTNITLPKNYNGENYSIGEAAFDGCTSLTNINIPNTVTTIDRYAFYNCFGLTSLTIPNSVTSIGDYAFYDCKNLKTVINFSNLRFSEGKSSDGYIAYYADKVYNIPNGEIIDNFIFKNDNTNGYILDGYMGNETNITLPENFKGENYSIGTAFKGNTELTSITIPNSVTSIGGEAFYGCTGLTSITIPNSVTSIEYDAFNSCTGLTSITIPNSVTSIGGGAFRGCTGLTSITIPNSVTSIGNSAFSGCTGLTSITIPNSVTSIGESAFSGCTGLTNITIPNSVTSIGRFTFSGCTGLTSITIPNSVTSIGKSAFQECTGLTSITIPNSVTSIGSEAFYDCKNLKTVINFSNLRFDKGSSSYGYIAYYAVKVYNFPDGEIIDNFIFKNDNTNGYILDIYIGNETNITLPENVKGENYSIGSAFKGNKGLTSITIPNSVTSIGTQAFQDCTGLTSITIPNSVTSIGGAAFRGCTGLTSITIPNSVTSIGESAFSGCTGLTNITIPNSVTSTGNSAFSGCTGLTSITIPNSVTSIGYDAFNGCTGLTNITIPNSVSSIGYRAFYGCTGLTSITIPNSVTGIGESAFSGCTGLTSITIPNSVTSIYHGAFWGCTGLTYLTIENYNTGISTDVFDCSSVKELNINGEKFPTFKNLPKVEKIVIGDKIKEVADDAFNYCPVLNTLEFHCKRIYDWNFGTSKLTDVILGEEVAVIFGGAFEEIETLERLKVEAIVPPIADENTFSRLQYRMLEVSVPEIAIEDYKADEVWKKFSSIKGYVPTGIEDAVAETSNDVNIRICANGLGLDNADGMPVAVYGINGKLVVRQTNYNGEIFSLPKGIYVVRVGKTTKKVVVK